MRRSAVVFASLFTIATAACGGDSSSNSSDTTTPAVTNTDGSSTTAPSSTSSVDLQGIVMLIDVRSESEFGEGHVEGAVNFDFEAGVLAERLPMLVPDLTYGVYCRTGRRSALAKEMMEAAGFTDVRDLGSLEEASATLGLKIVK